MIQTIQKIEFSCTCTCSYSITLTSRSSRRHLRLKWVGFDASWTIGATSPLSKSPLITFSASSDYHDEPLNDIMMMQYYAHAYPTMIVATIQAGGHLKNLIQPVQNKLSTFPKVTVFVLKSGWKRVRERGKCTELPLKQGHLFLITTPIKILLLCMCKGSLVL